mgnify:CR=1 FL=1
MLGLVLIFYAVTLSPTYGEAESLDNFRPKVLPTNPFYLLKNLKRGFDRILTLSSKGRVELDLRISEEKVQEISALSGDKKDNSKEIEKHLKSFNGDLGRLKKDLAVFKSKNKENGKKTFDLVFDSVLAQHHAFENLEIESGKFRNLFGAARGELIGVVVLVSDLNGNSFLEKTLRFAEEAKDPYSQFGIIDLLGEFIDDPDFKEFKKIITLKNDLIWEFEGGLKALGDGERERFFNNLRLVTASKFLAFEDIREILTDIDLKSRFNSLRANEIDKGEAEGLFDEEEANAVIKLAEGSISAFEKESANGEKIPKETARRFMEQAQINLEQAQKFLAEGRFSSALPQAGAARAGALNGLSQILESEKQEETNQKLRVEFDRLKNEAKNKNQNEENNQKIYSLFGEAEKYLVVPKNIEELRKAKVILSELRNLLANY